MHDTGNPVEYAKDGPVGVIRLNNPPLNLGTSAGLHRLNEVLAAIERDETVRVVVLCAVGKVFAAGSDMKEMSVHLAQGTYVDVKMAAEVRIRDRLAYLPMPTIAAMDGSAYGGGFDLALSCDMRIVAPHVVLSLPEVTLGSFPGSGSAYRLTRLIGAGRAIQQMLFAEEMPAQRALELGVVNAIAENGSAFDLAMQWARSLAARSPVATRAIKQAVIGIFRPEQPWLDQLQLDLARGIAESGHLDQGIRAFFEKRAPQFE
jgi:enoyl-CoA hydratase/carnithine racemase